MRIKPLLKEVAFTGEFVDCMGREVNLTEELFQDALEGTQKLMDAGFNVRGYSSHFTDDSNDCMGTWRMLWEDSGSLKAIFEAIDEDSRARAKALDTSMVVEENIDLGNGISVPLAITRIDIVGQGAVVGTEEFKELFSRYQSGRQRATALPSRRCLLSRTVAPQKKGGEMKLSLKRGLARALGLSIDADVSDELIDGMIEQKLGLQSFADGEKEAEMSKALSRHFMPEEADEDEKAELMPEKGEKKVEAMAEENEKAAEMSAQLARQSKEIESLQDDKVNVLLDRIPEEKREAIIGQFARLRKAAGFELAFESVTGQVNAYADSPIAALSKFRSPGALKVADRPATKKANPKGENVLVAAARRKGLIKDNS